MTQAAGHSQLQTKWRWGMLNLALLLWCFSYILRGLRINDVTASSFGSVVTEVKPPSNFVTSKGVYFVLAASASVGRGSPWRTTDSISSSMNTTTSTSSQSLPQSWHQALLPWSRPPYFCTAGLQIQVVRASLHIGFVSDALPWIIASNHHHRHLGKTVNFHKSIETDAGIGHQISELVATMASAMGIPGATFVYQNASNWDQLAIHGSLSWAERFFMLDFGEVKFDAIVKEHNPKIVSMGGDFCDEMTFKDECNLMCERSHWDQSNAQGFSIFHSSVAMAYDRLKHVMRIKFRQSHFVPETYLFSGDYYNVAWHVRVGDISLHAGNTDLFANILAQLDILLDGFKVKMHIFAEDPGSGTNPPRGFGFLQDMVKGECVFVNDMDPPHTLYHFANADLVVSSGSSFSLITELLSPKPILISTPPKERVDCHFYETFDTLKVNTSGHMSNRSLAEARATIVNRYELYHLLRVPSAALPADREGR